MPTWLKALLIVFTVGLLVFAALGYGAYVWVKNNGKQLLESGKRLQDEAREFGTGKPESACVDEAIARLQKNKSLRKQISIQLFMGACLRSADPDPALCEGVPSATNPFKVASWASDECERRGMGGSQACAQILQEIPTHCMSDRNNRTPPTDTEREEEPITTDTSQTTAADTTAATSEEERQP